MLQPRFVTVCNLLVVITTSFLWGSETAIAAGACENYFSGKRMTLVIPFGAGGGYDAYGRILAPVLAEQTNARVVVRNMPGAGGMIALNSVANARPESLVMAVFDPINLLEAKLARQEAAELSSFRFLGAFNIEPTVWAARDTDLQEQARSRPLVVGLSSYTMINRVLLPSVALGWAVTTVGGYAGTADAALAMLRGDTDIAYAPSTVMRNFIDANADSSVFLSLSDGPNTLFPTAPYLAGSGGVVEKLVAGLDDNIRRRRFQFADLAVALSHSYRAIGITQNISPETQDCLERSINNALMSEDLAQAAVRQNLVLQPVSGKGINSMLENISDLVTTNFADIQAVFDAANNDQGK